MNAFKALYVANLREFMRDRTALFFTIVFPVLFILIFGLVFSREARLDARIGLVLDDGGAVAQQLAAALNALPHTRAGQQSGATPFAGLRFEQGKRAALEAKLRRGELDALVIVPAGTSDAVGRGTHAVVELRVDLSRQAIAPQLQAIINGVVERMDRQLTNRQPILELEITPVLATSLRPIDYLVPDMLAMSIMNLGLFATAPPLIALRTQGVLKRLSATPLSRQTLLAAYVGLRLTTSVLQTVLIMGVGVLVFDVTMAGSWLVFAGWVLLGTLLFIAVGFFVAAVARTEESGTTITNVLNLAMLPLSGIFFPVTALPAFIKPIAQIIPLTYVADAFRQTMLGASPDHPPWINLGVQAAWLVLMVALAIRSFTWEAP